MPLLRLRSDKHKLGCPEVCAMSGRMAYVPKSRNEADSLELFILLPARVSLDLLYFSLWLENSEVAFMRAACHPCRHTPSSYVLYFAIVV